MEKEEAKKQLTEKAGLPDKEEEKTPFILDPNKIAQRLDHAIGSIEISGEKYRYYGTVLRERIKKKVNEGKKNEKEITVPELVNALILEDGRIISKYTKPKNLHFEFDSEMSLKTNRWSLNSIKNFTEGNINKEDYTFEKVFKGFKKHYDESMVYESEAWYKFDAIWDLTTYFSDLIDKFLIIKHEGISGTAKSKGMRISANLSFNGKKFLCLTPANFFRYRHNNKATIYIEEAEKLFDQSKKQNVGDSELVEYLNGSYEKGNKVPRQNDKDLNQTDEFDPAGFTKIGSVNELRGALQQRSLPKQMIKAPKGDKRGDVEVPPENAPEYQKSRDMAYICGLLYYKDFLKALDEVQNNYGLANRQWVLARPLLATARCISPELEKEMGNFIARGFDIRDEKFDDNSWEKILAGLLVELWGAKRDSDFIPVEYITELFTKRIDGQYHISSQRVGTILVKLGLSNYKKRDSNGIKRGLEIDFITLIKLLSRQGWLTDEEIIKKVSNVSERQYTEEKIKELLSDTRLTPDTLTSQNQENKTSSDTSDDLTPNIEGKDNEDSEGIVVEKI